MMKPRYVLIKWNGWDNVASFIESRKELRAWLKDGSLEENDILYEIKTKFKVKKGIGDSLCYGEVIV